MPALFLILSAAAAVAAAEPTEAWTRLLPQIRADETGLGVRPERWEARLTNPAVEEILARPLSGMRMLRSWDSRLSTATPSGLLRFAAEQLGAEPAAGIAVHADGLHCPELPPRLARVLGTLAQALAQAKIPAPPPPERRALEIALRGILVNEPSLKLEAAAFDEAAGFDAAALSWTAAMAAAAIEDSVAELRAAPPPKAKVRCLSPAGEMIVGSEGDDDYSSAELSSAALVVDVAGRNRYIGPAAAAGPGQLRVVIDLGHDALFESSGPAAGSGNFGIGLLYALGGGTTTITAGDFSAGAGFFGVGAAVIGGAAKVDTLSFGQGAGAFGIGVLELRGPARLSARFSAEGFGFTRGVGLFLARRRVEARCGLHFPDAREGLAWISFCQGAGYGPRAYAGGGLGLARIDGEGSRLEASYFAQGAGYWRGLGALFVHGPGHALQARRYGQGSGVHAAVGALSLHGDGIKTVHWGVGPAFGWDYGVGYLDADGKGQRLRSDWATGRGELNSRSFTSIRGEGAELMLQGLATAAYQRGGASYALVSIEGAGHRLRSPLLTGARTVEDLAQSPWAALSSSQALTLDPAIPLPEISWPHGDRASFARRDEAELERRLEGLGTMSPEERAAELLFIISRFGLAPAGIGRAVERLARTPVGEASALVAALVPERFDELIWIRLLAAALGRPGASAAADALPRAAGLRKALILGLLRAAPIDAASIVPGELRSEDWRVRKEAAGALGTLYALDRGEEPGRLRLFEDALDLLDGKKSEEDFCAGLGVKRLADLYAALALIEPVGVGERLALLEAAGNPFDNVRPQALTLFVKLLRARARDYQNAFAAELSSAQASLPQTRRALAVAARDSEPEVAAAALLSLGRLGAAGDAALLASALKRASAIEREAAAGGLARLGPAAREALAGSARSPSAVLRAQAAVGAAQSWDAEVMVSGLRRALSDREASVRRAALASLSAVAGPLHGRRKDLLEDIKKIARRDPSASLRASAEIWLGEIDR